MVIVTKSKYTMLKHLQWWRQKAKMLFLAPQYTKKCATLVVV